MKHRKYMVGFGWRGTLYWMWEIFVGVDLIRHYNTGGYKRSKLASNLLEEQDCPACLWSTPQQGTCKHESNTACLISTLVTPLSYWRPLEIGLIRYIVIIFTFYEQGLYLWSSSSSFLLVGQNEPCEHSSNDASDHSCSNQPSPDLTGLLKVGC